MSIHTEKQIDPQQIEKENTSTFNTIPSFQPHQESPIQQLANNSAQVAQLKQIKNVADRSAPVVQLKELQEKANLSQSVSNQVYDGNKKLAEGNTSDVIQAKIDPNKLNLVGEFHPESDKQRKKEKKLSKLMSNSDNYWEEHEFTTQKKKPGTIFSSVVETEADPFELRVLQALHFIKNSKDNEEVSNWVIFIETLIENLRNRTVGQELPDHNRNYFFKKIIPEITQIKDLATRDNLISDIITKTSTVVAEMRGQQDKDFKQEQNVTKERSEEMHKAAQQQGSKLKGVWKIGDQHVKDLTSMTPRDYELTTQVDFQTYLNTFKQNIDKTDSEKKDKTSNEKDSDFDVDRKTDMIDQINDIATRFEDEEDDEFENEIAFLLEDINNFITQTEFIDDFKTKIVALINKSSKKENHPLKQILTAINSHPKKEDESKTDSSQVNRDE